MPRRPAVPSLGPTFPPIDKESDQVLPKPFEVAASDARPTLTPRPNASPAPIDKRVPKRKGLDENRGQDGVATNGTIQSIGLSEARGPASVAAGAIGADGRVNPMWGSAQQVIACNAALAGLRESGRSNSFRYPLTQAEKQREMAFLSNCLGPPDLRILDRLGRLVLKDETLCTVLFMTPRRGITARHCLFDKMVVGGSPYLDPVQTDMSTLRVEFGSSSSPRSIQVGAVQVPVTSTGFVRQNLAASNKYALEGFTASKRDTEQRDYVVLELVEPMTKGNLVPIPLATPRFGDKVFLPAYHEPALLEDKPGDGGFRQQMAGFCQVIQPAVDRCMTHTCSTTPGASGAPILIEREVEGKPRLHLVGVHTGASRELAACLGSSGLDGVVNYGVRLTAQDVAQLQ